MRGLLSRGPEDVVRGSEPEETMKETLRRLKDCDKLIAVGDLVCYSLLANGVTPDICVIDGKTKRTCGAPGIEEGRFSKVLKSWNPPGHITYASLRILRKAVAALGNDEKVLVRISGEEDLLALPLIISSPEGSCVIVGMPNVGVGYMRIDEGVKKRVKEIMERFATVDLKRVERG
ncbi:MAG: GTP-dependent dephospho-CoA kinase family protein [Zestosphaera sp.]